MAFLIRVLSTSVLTIALCACVNTDVKDVTYRASVNFTSKNGSFLDYVYAKLVRNNNTVTMHLSPHENMEHSESFVFENCAFSNSKEWACIQDTRSLKMSNDELVLMNTKTNQSDTFKPFAN